MTEWILLDRPGPLRQPARALIAAGLRPLAFFKPLGKRR